MYKKRTFTITGKVLLYPQKETFTEHENLVKVSLTTKLLPIKPGI